MIISHRHRFIFVKTAKTAGSSVEVFLSSICADEDVVTPLNPPEEGHQPRNHSGLFNPWRELLSGNRKTRRITLRDWRNQARYWSHLPARLAVCRLGKERWCSYFKFSVERNPWDKTLSHYHMVNTMRGGWVGLRRLFEEAEILLEPSDLHGLGWPHTARRPHPALRVPGHRVGRDLPPSWPAISGEAAAAEQGRVAQGPQALPRGLYA